MAMSKVRRIKALAIEQAPQSREEVNDHIRRIGEHQRDRQKIQAQMNDQLARVRERFEATAQPHGDAIKALTLGVQAWCEANREDLTRGGKNKTIKFAAGGVKWRMRPPSVIVRGAEAVIEALRGFGLDRFIRVKEEVNKDAVLADPEAVANVSGISVTQREDFVIEPFETELEEVA